MPYSEGLRNFLKVYVFVPSNVKKCRDMVEAGEIRLNGRHIFD